MRPMKIPLTPGLYGFAQRTNFASFSGISFGHDSVIPAKAGMTEGWFFR
jgi:hypothetical protein